MVKLNLSTATTTDMTNQLEDYSVPAINTDSAGDQDETEYLNTKWSQYFGYYKQIPELKRAIDARAIWTVGKGYKADPTTSVVLDNISGWGQDTFNSIMKNLIICAQIGGDAFAEIIRDSNSGELSNLKPLDPSTIKIIVDRKGIIKRYEQIAKVGKKGSVVNKWKPREILHLCRDRVADEIHGVSVVEAVEDTILRRNEAITDWKKALHRNVYPRIVWRVDTDNASKIAEFKSTVDTAVKNAENIIIPQGSVEHEILAVPANATLNPMSWIENQSDFFFQAVGLPQIIIGGGKELTEANAKIAYLSFQQTVEDWQMDIESQLWSQLSLRVEFDFPASLQNELISSEQKNTGQTGFQPNDMIAGRGE